jgi:hypothetical protein
MDTRCKPSLGGIHTPISVSSTAADTLVSMFLIQSGLGGPGKTKTITVDLVELNKFSMDKKTWYATIGAGTLLGDVTTKLHDAGGRAFAHGVCPGVGIGGHATIVCPSSTDPICYTSLSRPL